MQNFLRLHLATSWLELPVSMMLSEFLNWKQASLVGGQSLKRQGSKLMLTNLRNASYFDNLRVRKISSSKRLQVRIMQISQTFGQNLLVEKILLAKFCEWIKKLTLSPERCKKIKESKSLEM